MKPFQIVSPMSYPGTGTTLAVARHHDSIGVSFLPPAAQSARLSDSFGSPLTPAEWVTLIARLGEIPDPVVQSGPSAASIPDTPEPAHARQGAGNGNG
jgi:hypothetical protein